MALARTVIYGWQSVTKESLQRETSKHAGGGGGGFGRSMLLRPAGGVGLRMSRSRPGVDVLAGPLLSGSVELR